MSFRDNVKLDDMSEVAVQQFNDIRNHCSKIRSDLKHKLNGNSRASLVGTLFGTLIWAAVYSVFFLYVKDNIEPIVALILLVFSLVLIFIKIVDVFQSFRYYGALLNYNSEIEKLISRIDKGINAIKSNKDKLSSGRGKGWEFQFSLVQSIPGQVEKIQKKIANMESLKNGFINNAKTALFFAVGLAVTVAGSFLFFEDVADIIDNVLYGAIDYNLSYDVLFVGLIIIMVIACIIEIILSKLVWGLTDCNVTNITLLMTFAGPLIFILLSAVVTIIVLLVVLLVYLLVIGIALAIAAACCSGG